MTAILGMGHSTPGLGANQPGLRHDPEWFRTAVFYEVLVRAFGDSTGSGEGDFAGIVNRLDYLQWLGVDCLWLPPFYASPLRDGGYDISDYTQVLPEFGTLPEFRELITQAHARGIRIITDFVMNHTSDQHPWFQASRSDPDGPYGDFYVWSDTDDRYTDARIIFVDTETSNWTFDPIRRQFFWHRFFSHQPDLNFENPAVHEAMFDVVRFWMDMGIDGFRLDAVPYLFEEEGHNGENHPKTHEFLAELRAMVDTEYPGRILLAEANQPPARRRRLLRHRGGARVPDVLPLPGDADALLRAARGEGGADHRRPRRHPGDPDGRPVGHLPAQPRRADPRDGHARAARRDVRLVRPRPADARQRRHPPPARPAARQLAPRDRADPRPAAVAARLPVPLLRRRDRHGRQHLAPRPRCRAHPDAVDPRPQRGLLHRRPGQALPAGDPVARLPPQPRQRRGADGVSGSSLLHWVRGMLSVRREHPVFGLGDFEVCESTHERVLAFVRVDRHERDTEDRSALAVLCVNNLSSRPQSTTVTLPEELWDWETRDLFGGSGFPDIGADGTITITLGSRDFFWLALAPRRGEARG